MTKTKLLTEFFTAEGYLEVRDCGSEIGFCLSRDKDWDDDNAEPDLIMIPKHKFDWIIETYLNRQLNVTETKQ